MSEDCVLDSYAILAMLGREPGSEDVALLFRRAAQGELRLWTTWVNLGEVAYIVERRWGTGRLYEILAMVEATALRLVGVGRELALMAARIKAVHSIAYADAFAAALAKQNEASLVTGDPEFQTLEDDLEIHWLPRRAP